MTLLQKTTPVDAKACPCNANPRVARAYRGGEGMELLGVWKIACFRALNFQNSEPEVSANILGILFEPQPPHTRQKYEQKIWPPNCRICLVLKHWGSYFVQMFVHVFALYVGGGGKFRKSGNGQVSLIFGVPNFSAFFASTCTLNRQRTRSGKKKTTIRDTKN